MHRIDTPGTSPILPPPGPGAVTPGYFTDGNPTTNVAATIIDADWLNAVQEEQAAVIEGAGLALEKGNNGQLLEAIQRLSGAQVVRTPVNVAPAAGAVGVIDTPTFRGSQYYSLYGLPQLAARIQIAVDAGFATVIYDVVLGATTVHVLPSGTLATATGYHWRIAYQDGDGQWSLWSLPTAFTTAAVFKYVRRPTNLTPADGASGQPATPILTSSALSVYGGADTHVASRWQVAADAVFGAPLHDSGEVADLVSHTVPAGAGLAIGGAYHWRVQHKGQVLGWGDWSYPTAFAVGARPARPINVSPADGATHVAIAPTLQSSSFAMLAGSAPDSHVASQWRIGTTAAMAVLVHDSGEVTALTSYTVPAGASLAVLTGFFWEVRHKGAASGWGDWSTPTGFTTSQPHGAASYGTPGIYSWVAPANVFEVYGKVTGSGAGGDGDAFNASIGENGASASFGSALTAYGGKNAAGGRLGGGFSGGEGSQGGPGGGKQQNGGDSVKGGGGGGGGGGTVGDGIPPGTGGQGGPLGAAGASGYDDATQPVPARPGPGGGGGGAMNNGGGGGGGATEGLVPVVPGQTYTVTVPAGGNGGSGNNPGGPGGHGKVALTW